MAILLQEYRLKVVIYKHDVTAFVLKFCIQLVLLLPSHVSCFDTRRYGTWRYTVDVARCYLHRRTTADCVYSAMVDWASDSGARGPSTLADILVHTT